MADRIDAVEIAARVRRVLSNAANDLDSLELEGKAKWCRKEAALMQDRGERIAKRIAKEGSKEEREAKKAEKAAKRKERKAERIAKLREKLAKLTEEMDETEEAEEEEVEDAEE